MEMQRNRIERRKFLQIMTLIPVASVSGMWVAGCGNQKNPELIEKIESSIIWPGRTEGRTWFHPRVCVIPSKPNPVALMTCQTITGSDVYSQVFWSSSSDYGRSWIWPQPIASLGRQTLPGGIEEGTCDVVPDYHAGINSVLAIGHNVYYKNDVLTQPYQNRGPGVGKMVSPWPCLPHNSAGSATAMDYFSFIHESQNTM